MVPRLRGRRGVVGSILAIALLLTSISCSEPSGSEAESASSGGDTTEPVATSSPEVEDRRTLTYPAEPLPVGANRTEAAEGVTQVSFEVGNGWWGEQSGTTGWMVAWGPMGRPERAKVFLGVDELDVSYEDAVNGFTRVRNLEPGEPKPIRVGGHRGVIFDPDVKGQHALLDEALGVPIDVVGRFETRQAFVPLGEASMIVRMEFPRGERYVADALRVLRSFRFGG